MNTLKAAASYAVHWLICMSLATILRVIAPMFR